MAIKKFTIKPGIGAEPILFGMTRNQVSKLLGPPTDFFDECEEFRDHVTIVYDKNDTRVEEIEFSPGVHVWFQDHRVFEMRDLIGFLTKFDPKPYEHVGTVIFHKLGIATDVRVESKSERTIAVFRLGLCDDEIKDSVPYRRKNLPKGRKSPN